MVQVSRITVWVALMLVMVAAAPAAAQTCGETYEVMLSRGRAIRVGSDFDSDVLKRLIAAVES